MNKHQELQGNPFLVVLVVVVVFSKKERARKVRIDSVISIPS